MCLFACGVFLGLGDDRAVDDVLEQVGVIHIEFMVELGYDV